MFVAKTCIQRAIIIWNGEMETSYGWEGTLGTYWADCIHMEGLSFFIISQLKNNEIQEFFPEPKQT